MDEALVGALEAAVADVGALVVRVERYRRGVGPEGAALRAEALALGDEARRRHRAATLDDAHATRLLEHARRLADRLRALAAGVVASGDYRAARTAYASGD